MRHREPFFNLIRSVWDCFTNTYLNTYWGESFVDAYWVIRYWWNPELQDLGDDPLGDWHGRNY